MLQQRVQSTINQIQQLFQLMDEQEDLEMEEGQSSNVFRNQRWAEINKQAKNKTSSALYFIIAGAALLFILMAYKIYQLQNATTHLQSSAHADTPQVESSGANAPAIPSSNVKINQLELKIQSLSQLVQKLQNELGQQPKTSKTLNPATATSAQAMDHIESMFASHKVTINFLHMHSRETYYYHKVDFLKECQNNGLTASYEKAKVSFMQALGNFKLPHTNVHIEKEVNDWHQKERQRLEREYDFNKPELPFCIVVPTLNNAKNFRYQYNLQSMVNLDYKNFKIVIVDDASTDYTYELIKQWIEENEITHNIVVLTNEKRMTAVPNIHRAITQHCGKDDIVVLVDGDDELLGRYSLKVFNDLYQKHNAEVVYSNHIQFYTHIKQTYRGWSMDYSPEEKKNNLYRDVVQRIAHLRSFKARLYLAVKEADLKDEKGEWLASTYDEVICLPVLELSCGRIVYIEEFFYLYNFGIGTNDLQVDPVLQKNIANYVKEKKPKYGCLPGLS